MTKAQAITKIKGLLKQGVDLYLEINSTHTYITKITSIVLIPNQNKKEYYYNIENKLYILVSPLSIPMIKVGQEYYPIYQIIDNEWVNLIELRGIQNFFEPTCNPLKYALIKVLPDNVRIGDIGTFILISVDNIQTSYWGQVISVDDSSITIATFEANPRYVKRDKSSVMVEYFKMVQV